MKFLSKTEKKYLGIMVMTTTVLYLTGISYKIIDLACGLLAVVGAFKEHNIPLNAYSISAGLMLMRLSLSMLLTSQLGMAMGILEYGSFETYIDILAEMPWNYIISKARTLVRK